MTGRTVIFTGIKALLRPVVRLCLRSGVSTRECIELLKAAFLDVAEENLLRDGHEVNMSRLAAATGLQRKDIAQRIKTSDLPDDSLISKILGNWFSGSEFQDKQGKPKRLTHEGVDSEFAQLVRGISSDLNPYTLLFELERTGKISKSDGLVRLESSVHILETPEDFARACQIVEHDWTDMFSAADENIRERNETPNLHLRTEFDNLTLEALPKIREWILDRGTTFHEDVRNYISKFDKDANPRLHKKVGGGRIAIGAFSFTEGVADNATPFVRTAAKKGKKK